MAMRIDIWDVEAVKKQASDIDCGYPRNLEEKFELGAPLGKGGFGLVRCASWTSFTWLWDLNP
jgi:hypothetical protein